MPNIVIVGAGISGLSLAYRIRQRLPNVELTLLEASPRAGGNIATEREDGFQFDIGPNGFLDNKSSTIQLCRDLGLESELIPASEASRRHRFLLFAGRLQRLPSSPLSLVTTRLLSWRGKLALLREPLRRRSAADKEESVAEFFRRRIGTEATQVFVDALVTGIHGGDPELLSMRSAFPRVWKMEQESGSIVRGFWRAAKQRVREARNRGERKPAPQRMWSFRTGLGRLVQRLEEVLGGALQCRSAVQRIEAKDGAFLLHLADNRQLAADVVVLACPAWRQAEIAANLDQELSQELTGIAYTPIAVVVVGYRQEDVPRVPDGFGYIAPQHQRRDVLGVQWCSAIFPERAPPGFVLWRALCGGWNRRDIMDWTDDRLTGAVDAELSQSLGVHAAPVFRRVVRWPQAIPQYFVGHQQRVARIEMLAARRPGLILTGNALHGIAINDCTEQAEIIAKRLAGIFATPATPR